MSGLFCANSPPTSENNGKNSSGTSTCNGGGVHLCPFQLAPPINQYTYCVLKRICRKILEEILFEERKENISVEHDVKVIQNGDVINETNISPNDHQNSSSLESPLTTNPHQKLSDVNSMKGVLKSNKTTQTEKIFLNGVENFKTTMKNCNFNKRVKKDKNITIKPELHKSGLPVIVNLRLKVRNGEMLGKEN